VFNLLNEKNRFRLKKGMIESLSMIKVERDINSFSWYHDHEFIEVAYCESGSGKHIIDGKEFDMKAGDVFLFNAGVFHKLYAPESKFSLINVMLRPEVLPEGIDPKNFVSDYYSKVYCGGKADNEVKDKFIRLSGGSRENYGMLFSNILNEYNLRFPCYVDVIQNESKVLLIKIFRDFTANIVSENVTAEQQAMIEQIMHSIDENICSINKIDDIMEQVGYNKIYFNRLFQKYVGTSISRYLKKKKMDYACNLLASTNYTVEHICEIIGYNDIKNFYKTFKAVEKITPGAFREKVVHNYKKV
jgi:AraC-like DNA-binding protein/mannose-6-phosphate isomerase-like protein (cupin superfamily)